MNQCTDSLWSPEIKPGLLSPRDVLELQVMALRDQSGGLLNAEIRCAHDKAENAIYLIFEIWAPSLAEERSRILTARSFADRIYPCHLDAVGLRTAEAAHSEEEFRELVRQVLHSGEVKSLALSLMARAKEALPRHEPGITRRHNGHKRLFRPAWAGVDLDDEHIGNVDALYDEAHGID
jgi:hypothetical protein